MHLHGRAPGYSLAGLLAGCVALLADDWPQWMGPQRDGVWRERGVVERFPEGGPRVLWRTAIGAGYSGPVVAGDRVFLTDRPSTREAGTPQGPVDRAAVAGVERVLCVSVADGAVLWRHEYDCPYNLAYPSGPRASPIVGGGRVYTLGAEGDLRCLDVERGTLVWSKKFKQDYGVETQTWGHAAQLLLDGERLVCLVGGAGHTVVAFARETGRELWRALDAKEPGYSAPVIVEAGGRRQLIVWDTEAISSLDPESGAAYWSHSFPTRMGHCIATPRHDGRRLFISSFFDGSLMLDLDQREPRAAVAWRLKGRNEEHPEGLHSLMSTPFLEADHVYGVCSYGQLRCLKAGTGERVWETLAATTTDGKPARWATAFLVKHQDRFFLWNEKGDLMIARLSPAGYEELSRAHLLEPTNSAGGRDVHWSHPAFAGRSMFARNDRELIRVDLRAR